MTRSKEVTIKDSNELTNVVSSSFIDMRVIAFEEMSWINRLYKNEVTLEMAQIEAIYYII